jgi:peptidoglycan/LPS O-acetylase OafA/YrhL
MDTNRQEFIDIISCATATAASLGNIWLWLFLRVSYFSDVLRTTFLLHMWSLGVEEQFYWALPLLLRWTPLSWLHRLVLPSLVAASSGIAWWAHIHLDASASYYLLPFCMAELLVGVWLAIHLRLRKNEIESWYSQHGNEIALLATSVLCVIAGTWDATVPFPSVSALVPTLASGLIIFAGTWTNPMSRVLGTPLLAWVGTLSYSMYLWHWPAIVLLNRWRIDHTSVAFVALFLSGLIA